MSVKVENPLKQGLKQWNLSNDRYRFDVVKVENPLKQGLKQYHGGINYYSFFESLK